MNPYSELIGDPVKRPRRVSACFATGLLVLSAFAASCASETTMKKRAMEIMGPPQAALQGQATLLAGRLQARVRLDDVFALVGPGGGLPDGGPSSALSGPRDPGGGPGAGGMTGGGMGMGGGGMPGGAMAGGPPGGGMGGGGMPDLPPEMLAQLQSQMRTMAVKPPRLILRVELFNGGQENLEVTIRDLDSPLGNFSVRPERIALAAGQRVSLDPMLSNTDLRFERLDVKVTIRSAGAAETVVIPLVATAPATGR